MTHIHRTHGHHKPHLSTGQLKPAEAPSGGAPVATKPAKDEACAEPDDVRDTALDDKTH